MGFLSKIEGKMEDVFENTASKMGSSSISPVQIIKKAEKQMRREKLVSAGKQYAPTLYTVLVSPEDDKKLSGFYPTLAGEAEMSLLSAAAEDGLSMDGKPLVRFMEDEGLRRGKFYVVAEVVSALIVEELRREEMQRYGLANVSGPAAPAGVARAASPRPAYAAASSEPAYSRPAASADFQAQADDPFAPKSPEEYAVSLYQTPLDWSEAADSGAADGPPVLSVPEISVPAVTRVFNESDAQALSGNQAKDRATLTDAKTGRKHAITAVRAIVGRETSCDIRIADPNVSRQHAQITFEPQGVWRIEDLGSTNGTEVNGRAVTAAVLRDRDQIKLGVTTLTFEIL